MNNNFSAIARRNIFAESFGTLKSAKTIVITAMLIAITIVLDQPFLSLRFGNGLKLNFIFVPVMLCASFYGPVVCAAMCVIGDVMGVILSGQAVLPQLIIVEIVRGVLMGCIMFRRKPTLARIVAAQSVANLFVNMCLNTAMLIWAGYLSAQNVFLSVGTRVLKNIAFLPVEIIILFLLLNSLFKAMEKNRLKP